jgi:hypothetical protein
MTDAQQPDSTERTDQPGKTRTMWHPLLVRLLSYTLASAYTVTEEVSVGKVPLRIDVLLIRREDGTLLDSRKSDLSALLPLLNRFTLIEFKGPTDAMQQGDFAKLVGCAFLWHSQENVLVAHHELSLVVLLPAVGKPLHDELQALGLEASLHEPGIYRVVGLQFLAWLVETDVMAERGEPVLSLVSRAFLNDRRSIIEKLAGRGFGALAQYRFMVQEVKQFHSEEDFAMQQALSEHLDQFTEELVTKMLEELPAERRLRGLPTEEVLRDEELVTKMLEEMPAERRLRGLPTEEVLRDEELVTKMLEELPAERRLRGLPTEEVLRDEELVTKMLEELPAERRLSGLPPEDRLRGLPPEERVRGLSVEELLASLTDEQAARLRQLIDRKEGR